MLYILHGIHTILVGIDVRVRVK